jgi:hypothetical protein
MIAFGTGAALAAVVLAGATLVLRRAMPRTAAVSVGFALVFLLVAGAEFALRVAGLGKRPVDVVHPDPYYTTDEHGLLEPLPGAHRTVATILHSGETLYDVVYTVDDEGRRVVPDHGGPYGSYAIFVGDSFTYGVGVEDHETLPAAYANLHDGVHVYNYGFQGSGPFDVLARLETMDFATEIAETTGSIIYLFINEHVLRSRDFLLGTKYRGKRIAYEENDNGRLVRCGTWETCHAFYHDCMVFLASSRIVSLLGFEFPVKSEDYERTAQAILQMQEVVNRRARSGAFSVVFYPGSVLSQHVRPLLEERGIACVDLSETFDGTADEHVLSVYDRHPAPGAYARVATLISERTP